MIYAKNKLKGAWAALKDNLLLVFSALTETALYIPKFLYFLFPLFAICEVILIAVFPDYVRRDAGKKGNAAAALAALFLNLYGIRNFYKVYVKSKKFIILSNFLSQSPSFMRLLCALAGACLGLYSVYVLTRRLLVASGDLLKNVLPATDFKTGRRNAVKNSLFILSAAAFFTLNTEKLDKVSIVSLLFALSAFALVATQTRSITDYIKRQGRLVKLFSLGTARGIVLFGHDFFIRVNSDGKIKALERALKIPFDLPKTCAVLGAVIGFFFVYVCLLFFFEKLGRVFRDGGVFRGLGKTEAIVYCLAAGALFCMVVFAYTKSRAFYSTDFGVDIIFSYDSSGMVENDVFLYLTGSQNDLRQSLFTVFAAPFHGLEYLINRAFSLKPLFFALLIEAGQIVTFLASRFIIARARDIEGTKRVCFILFSCCAYSGLVNVLMIEQYVTANFYLSLLVFYMAKGKKPPYFAVYAATGTLISDFALVPFARDKNPLSDFRGWLCEMIKVASGYILLMLAFMRFDVIFHSVIGEKYFKEYRRFLGAGLVPFDNRFFQYTGFVKNLFLPPKTTVSSPTYSAYHESLVITPFKGADIIGLLILFAVIICLYFISKEKIGRLCAFWVLFSFVLLVPVGYGTAENCLLIYSLYFGWAFILPIFLALEKLEKKSGKGFLIPLFTLLRCAAMLYVNAGGIGRIVRFAAKYFPA